MLHFIDFCSEDRHLTALLPKPTTLKGSEFPKSDRLLLRNKSYQYVA